MRRPLLNKAQIDAVVDAMPPVAPPPYADASVEWVRTEHGAALARPDLRITLYLAARLDVTGRWPGEDIPLLQPITTPLADFSPETRAELEGK